MSAAHAVDTEVRLYDRLFTRENPDDVEEGEDFTASINPESLKVVPDAKVEPSLEGAPPGKGFQFERQGYFAVDPDSLPENLRVTHVSLFDGSIQGLERTDRPAFCFQGHPEASPGPQDIHYLFDRFVALMDEAKARKGEGGQAARNEAAARTQSGSAH